MKYPGPDISNPMFVSIWKLHEKLSSDRARNAYEQMYQDWFEDRGIRYAPSTASGYENLPWNNYVVGYYIADAEDRMAFKLTFGL